MCNDPRMLVLALWPMDDAAPLDIVVLAIEGKDLAELAVPLRCCPRHTFDPVDLFRDTYAFPPLVGLVVAEGGGFMGEEDGFPYWVGCTWRPATIHEVAALHPDHECATSARWVQKGNLLPQERTHV